MLGNQENSTKSSPCHFSRISTLAVVIFLLFASFSAQAQKLDALKLSEQFNDAPLRSVLKQLEETYEVPFYFKNEWLENTSVSATANDELFVLFINQLLRDTKLSFAVFNNNSIIIAPSKILSRKFSQEYFVNKENQEKFLQQDNWPLGTPIINLGNQENLQNESELIIDATLTDGLEGDVLIGALVKVKDLDLAATSDANGKFKLNIPQGLHLLEISMIGYETKLIGVNLINSTAWNVELLPEARELDEVLVSATADDSNVKSTVVGMTTLSALDIRDMPVFLGEPDVIQSILTLPGVSTVGEGAGGFNVRGGNIDQNLIMQDDALVFNSSHAMGFFSVFNPDVIRDVTLYKGHIPAQYGGRVSSVLDVKLKGNNYENLKVNGGVGMLASRVTLETPLVKDKTSLLLGGRVAYSDWVLNFVNKPAVKESSLSFYDINAKISQRLGDKGTLSVSFYNSKDRFVYGEEFGFSWNTTTAGVNWNQVIAENIISELSINNSRINNTNFQPDDIDAFELANGINNTKIKEDILITSLQKHTINAGFEINAYQALDETLEPYNEAANIIPFTGEKDNGLETALYINDAIDLTDRLSFSLGLRYTYYNHVGPGTVNIYENGIPSHPNDIIGTRELEEWESGESYQGLDPRISLVYLLNSSSSLKMSFNIIHQFIHLISNTTSSLPIDYWQVSNSYLKPITSLNFSLGYFKNFLMNQWETSAEVYYRDLENVVEYKDFPQLFLNNHLETELISGKGRAYGLELFIKRKTGKLNGWLSYTFARSLVNISDESRDLEINRGEWFPSQFDQPHKINLVGNLNFNKTNQLSFNFTYSTGRPLTGPDSNYLIDNTIVPNFSDRNEYRLPAYHRLDVSYTIQRGVFRTSRYNDSFTFSVYNLYARKNAYSIFFQRGRDTPHAAYKFSILGTMLPSVTYNFNF